MDYANDLGLTPVMLSFLKDLFGKRQLSFKGGEDEWVPWITQISPWYINEDYEAVGLRVPLGNIDFFIHGENLLAKYWKQEQVKNSRPFMVIHEWRNAKCDDVSERFVDNFQTSMQIFPEFIDPFGKGN